MSKPPPLFPLPAWPRSALPSQKRKIRKRGWLLRGVADACVALNCLASSRAGVALAMGTADTAVSWPTDAQDSVRSHLGRRVRAMGAPPGDLTPMGALREYLKTSDPYHVDRASPVVDYDPERVKVVRDGICPKPLADLCGPRGREILEDLRGHVLLNDRELAAVDPAALAAPYFDPKLREPSARRQLGLRLSSLGLAAGRRYKKSVVGIFTVTKKENMQRLVFDCRQTNGMCARPPLTSLASSAALAGLRWDTSAPASDQHAFFSALDLTDGFFQFAVDEIASYFSLGVQASAEELGQTSVLNEITGVHEPVGPEEKLWICLRTLPPGWSWALMFCQDVLTERMVMAEHRRCGA